MKILLVANYEDGVGGISVQVGLLRDLLLGEGYSCEILSTKGSVANRIKATMKLLSIGRRYDVFHIHACSNRGFLPAVLGISIGRILKKRIVVTFHGGGAEGFFLRKQRLVQHFLTRTSANIVLSGFVGRVFDQYGIPYTVIPNVLEFDGNSFRERTDIKPRFISIRSFTEIYNVKCSLKAFGAVQEKYLDASLTLLGDGPLKSELEQFVVDHNIQNVSFVGLVPNSEVYRYLDNADIMVSSSRVDNMPVSILEGFKAGLLVIASNVGGIPYMIEDGLNGLLFESDNDREMAEKMTTAVEYPEHTLDMIKKARLRLKQYTWEVVSTQLFPLYNSNL